jgi:hypothetical protein
MATAVAVKRKTTACWKEEGGRMRDEIEKANSEGQRAAGCAYNHPDHCSSFTIPRSAFSPHPSAFSVFHLPVAASFAVIRSIEQGQFLGKGR